MKVRALLIYNDKELVRTVMAGEILEVTEERAEVLLKGNASSKNKPFVEVVEEKEQVEEKEIVLGVDLGEEITEEPVEEVKVKKVRKPRAKVDEIKEE